MYKDRQPIPVDQRLITQVHNTNVDSGLWKTEYHHPIGWKAFEDFPRPLQPLLDQGLESFDFLQRWQPEAFIISDGIPWETHFSVILKGENPPLHIPWFGRPTLDQERVFLSFLDKRAFPNWHGYRKMLWISRCSQEPEIGEVKTNFILKPFVFFDVLTHKIVGEDPFRVKLGVVRMPMREIKLIQSWAKSALESANQDGRGKDRG